MFLKELMLIKQMNHYWYFLEKGFNFQMYVFIGFHDLLMMSINLNGIAILNINSVDYRCDINGIRKSEAVNLLQNGDLNKKAGHYKKYFLFTIYRNGKKNYKVW